MDLGIIYKLCTIDFHHDFNLIFEFLAQKNKTNKQQKKKDCEMSYPLLSMTFKTFKRI